MIKTLWFKYILAPLLIVWIRISVFVWLTHEILSYDPSSYTHDDIRESSTTFGAEESASRATRREPYYDLIRKKSLPDFRRLDVSILPTSRRLVPADVLTSCSCLLLSPGWYFIAFDLMVANINFYSLRNRSAAALYISIGMLNM